MQIYLLEFICNPKINTLGTFTVICGHTQSDENCEFPNTHVPTRSQVRSNKGMLSTFLFSFYSMNTWLLHNSRFTARFSVFLCLLLAISLFTVAPKHIAEVLSSVPKFMKAITQLMEKILVLNKLRSSISYSAAGRVVNKWTICINRNTHKTRLHIEPVMKMLQPEALKNLSLYFS